MAAPNSEWNSFPCLLISLGAILFFISDTLLAWNKFVNPIKYGSLFVIITSHFAQFAITIGTGLNFLLLTDKFY
jgi:uncharacterized membrane protein YhhN